MLDFYGKLVGKYTVRPMDSMGIYIQIPMDYSSSGEAGGIGILYNPQTKARTIPGI